MINISLTLFILTNVYFFQGRNGCKCICKGHQLKLMALTKMAWLSTSLPFGCCFAFHEHPINKISKVIVMLINVYFKTTCLCPSLRCMQSKEVAGFFLSWLMWHKQAVRGSGYPYILHIDLLPKFWHALWYLFILISTF